MPFKKKPEGLLADILEAELLGPDIPWRDIRGLGNRLRHAYDSIDTELIWVMIERDLDLLQTAIRKIKR